MKLLMHPGLPGDLNMAVDWWLLKQAREPVLRFYGWDQPSLTIGYRQQFQMTSELQQLLAEWPTSVRPTGGGYLLHAGELTYSLVIPNNHEMAEQDILSVYSTVRDALISGLPENHPQAEVDSTRGHDSSPTEDCLQSPGPHEPVWHGKKWTASAQVRRQGSVLQHGSVYLEAEQWPEDWTGHSPVFLDNFGSINRGELRKAMIKELTMTLNSTDIWIGQLSRSEWDDISGLRGDFQIKNSTDLPVFARTR